MLHEISDDELQAIIMYDAIKFRDFWEAGTALLRDEEDVLGDKEQMFSHAARFLALWGVVKNYKRLGWLSRITTKRMAARIAVWCSKRRKKNDFMATYSRHE